MIKKGFKVKILAGKEDKKILLYCTGDIRCEKASSYLIKNGFKNVNQLEGGIIQYAHEIKKKNIKSTTTFFSSSSSSSLFLFHSFASKKKKKKKNGKKTNDARRARPRRRRRRRCFSPRLTAGTTSRSFYEME